VKIRAWPISTLPSVKSDTAPPNSVPMPGGRQGAAENIRGHRDATTDCANGNRATRARADIPGAGKDLAQRFGCTKEEVDRGVTIVVTCGARRPAVAEGSAEAAGSGAVLPTVRLARSGCVGARGRTARIAKDQVELLERDNGLLLLVEFVELRSLPKAREIAPRISSPLPRYCSISQRNPAKSAQAESRTTTRSRKHQSWR
jgi:hypothetical protein